MANSKSAQTKSITIQAWTFVFIQAVLLCLIVFLDNKIGPSLAGFRLVGSILVIVGGLGIIVSAMSIRSSLTALPIPTQRAKLSTKGLYRLVRHPMYSSLIVLTLGIALKSGGLIKYLLVIGLAVLFNFKSNFEEQNLADKFPDYKKYASKTPRFIPQIRP